MTMESVPAHRVQFLIGVLRLQAKEAVQLIYGHFNLDHSILSAAFYAADRL